MDQITHDHNDMLSRSYESLETMNDSNNSSNGSLSEVFSRGLEAKKETKEEMFYDGLEDIDAKEGDLAAVTSVGDINLNVNPPPGCPFHVPPSAPVDEVPPAPSLPPRCPGSPAPANFDAIRRKLYSTKNVPAVFSQAVITEMGGNLSSISFLDHAWGKTPPEALVAASKRQYGLYQRGNSAWDVIFGDLLPESISHIKSCAILLTSSSQLKPVFTGWIADPSVLSPESKGIKLGSEVGYIPGYSLMGGTPAFMPSLLIFVEVMRRWKERNITVVHAHRHVMELHEYFIRGIEDMVKKWKDGTEGTVSCWGGMRPMADPEIRSHSITFVVDSSQTAKKVVELMASFGDIEIDSRKNYVR